MSKTTIQILILAVFMLFPFAGCKQEKPAADIKTQPSNDSAATSSQTTDFGESTAATSEAGELVWSDEFDGDSLDMTKWKYETGGNGWGNNELQIYSDGDNVEVSGGTLKITAKQIKPEAKMGHFTSARLNSLRSFKFGRLEVRARIPKLTGKGSWPAIWMLSESFPETPWPLCGEIDIMEYVSCTPGKVHFTVHSKAHNHMTGTHQNSGPIDLPTIEEQFHVYGFNWASDKIEFYLDEPSNIQFTVERPAEPTDENWPFEQPYYFLLNVAVGGSWGGMQGVEASAFPSTMEIDYVRVFK